MSVVKIALLATLVTLATVAFYSHSQAEIQQFSSQDSINTEFKAWKARFGKSYGGAEEAKRLTIFKSNKDAIAEHEAANPNRTYTVGVNQFADLTNEEFSTIYLGLERPEKIVKASVNTVAGENPASVDWRGKAVNPVKNQGSCGSCWAFSTVAAIEGFQAITTGELNVLSEQQIVDCSTENYGCGGGDMPPALRYTVLNGVQLESDYPYRGVDGKCKYDAGKVAFRHGGYEEVAANDWKALETAAAKQVIAVSVSAGTTPFQYYTGGVVNSVSCTGRLDHGVALVGYTADAWIIRNSWGPDWGENGYIRLAKGDQLNGQGICGINRENSYPTA